MKLSSGIAKIAFVTIFFVTLSFTLGACFLPWEPMVHITVNNQTDQTLQVFNADVFIGKADPGGEVKYDLGIYSYYTVVAKDMEGNVVYTTNFTRRDISGKKTYTVVIPPTAKGAEQSGNVTEK